MESHLPLILIEGVLVFGGVLAFGWWQIRDVKRERAKSQRAREAQQGASPPASAPTSSAPPPTPSSDNARAPVQAGPGSPPEQ